MKNDKYSEARHLMVEQQIRARGVSDERVLKAMEEVQRHLFVSESMQESAYDDCALSAGEGQTISQPYMVAVMSELLELKGDEKVLEIGTGSGYQAAVLSMLVSEVFTVERLQPLASRAERLLDALGFNNIHLHVADGTLGLPEHSPFDAIIVTAAAPKIPDTYLDQLKRGGRLVIPVGNRSSQILHRIKKTSDGTVTSTSTLCTFVPLIGEEGWNSEEAY